MSPASDGTPPTRLLVIAPPRLFAMAGDLKIRQGPDTPELHPYFLGMYPTPRRITEYVVSLVGIALARLAMRRRG